PFGPYLAWKRGDLLGVAQRLLLAGLAGVGAAILTAALNWRGPLLAPPAMALGAFIVVGALSEWAMRLNPAAGVGTAWRRARGLPRAVHGTTLAHLGVGLAVIGIVARSAWQSERVLAMQPGERAEIAGWELTFRGVTPRRGPNYAEQVGRFEVTRSGAPATELWPAKRLYDAPKQPTTEAAIHVSWRGDL